MNSDKSTVCCDVIATTNKHIMEKQRIYISGPISGHDLEARRKAFKEIQNMLEAQEYETFNPCQNGLSEDATTHEHMHRDLATLTRENDPFTAIFMMKGWLHSAGCKLEFDVATSIGLRVYFEEIGTFVNFK